MDRVCRIHGQDENCIESFVRKLKGRDHFEAQMGG
jgi:hypothetical protein